MKKIINNRAVWIWIGLIAILLAFYAGFSIPSREGLNPSDDGVIIAQSHRIFNGEIPHKDFISIRPVGSAVLHMISLILPFPFEITARWFVLLQYFVYSLFFALGLKYRLFVKVETKVLLPSLVLIGFVLNQNHYNLFPWTTIDALFWISISFFLYSRHLSGHRVKSYSISGIFMVFSAVMAALSRQTFALPALLILLLWMILLVRKRRLTILLMSIIVGSVPLILYGIVLINNQVLPAFIEQMTGRTEIWQTGFVTFWKSLKGLPVLYFLLIAIDAFFFSPEFGKSNDLSRWRRVQLVLMSLIFLALAFSVFIFPRHLFRLSFEFFWLLIFVVIITQRALPLKGKGKQNPVAILLLIAWTGSISLGDNSPVFSTGILAIAILSLLIRLYRELYHEVVINTIMKVVPILALSLLALSIAVQPRINYRDKASSELTADAGTIFPALQGVRVNPEMYSYLADIDALYNTMGEQSEGFAVIPNNAIMYPVLNIASPFNIDWLQKDEFVGSEGNFLADFENKVTDKSLVILVERFNVKWIADQRRQLNNEKGDYPWLPILESKAKELDSLSVYFRVFVTGQKKDVR